MKNRGQSQEILQSNIISKGKYMNKEIYQSIHTFWDKIKKPNPKTHRTQEGTTRKTEATKNLVTEATEENSLNIEKETII